jgi:MoxR-like ATPase
MKHYFANKGARMISSEFRAFAKDLVKALESKVLGQEKTIQEVVVTVLCQGHALLTGSPGVAKTTLVRNLASALGCGYKRIQFTPDLTPYDILGGDVLQFDDKAPDAKRVAFQPGPIFSSFLLADEINRASPRTQAALLEAMQERQVSHGGTSRALPKPFYVFATQNPIESEGTFPLPEAQLDRFLLNIEVPYPSFEAEVLLANLPGQGIDLPAFGSPSLCLQSKEAIDTVTLSTGLQHAIVRLVRNTRPEMSDLLIAKEMLEYGASPRATLALNTASKALAFLSGEKEVRWEHIQAIAPSVLRHRIVINFRALNAKRSATSIVNEIIASTLL